MTENTENVTISYKNEDTERDQKTKDKGLWRDLTAFFIIGLCNNYGYIIMLTAAHDLIAKFYSHNHDDNNSRANSGRNCNIISTGTVLLADILPLTFLKVILPYLPFWPNVRMCFAVVCSVASFLLVGFAKFDWVALLGIVAASASCGVGEITMLSYSSMFNKNVISTWSSGTGAAGVIGSLSYAMLLGFRTPFTVAMSIMLVTPTMEALAFWCLLRTPRKTLQPSSPNLKTEKAIMDDNDDEKPLTTFKEKFFYIRHLLKYAIPYFLVYFFEYFINQGLFELVHFKKIFLDKQSQYRWLCVDYEIGVFISRSSINIVQFRRTWILAILQFINVIYVLSEITTCYTPTIWIVFITVLWEGLLGGAMYVNTFYRLSNEISPARQLVAFALVGQWDCFAIVLAGFVAIPAHNAICKLPPCERKIVW